MSDFFEDFGSTEVTTHPADTKGRTAKKKRSLGKAFAVAGIVALIVAFIVAISGLLGSSGDYDGPGTGSVEIVIPEGATGKDIASILAENNVVKTEKAFIKAFKADSRSSSIQPGTYVMKQEMSASEALTVLLNPASKSEIKVTIPEGFTKQQVFERVAQIFDVPVEDVQAAGGDAGILGLPAEAGGNAEGWFAPLTYTFEPQTTPAEALTTMVAERVGQLEALSIPQDRWQEILIKASIIEREALAADDYPKVARVIENRLVDTESVNGRLQMDSTVLYGVGRLEQGGSPTQAELDADNPYNTYKNVGLTPTPIGNPGEAAINAALNPVEGTWLYFVTVNLDTGETKFATSLDEHEANIEEYRAWAAENPQ